jgi:hypothetical protein
MFKPGSTQQSFVPLKGATNKSVTRKVISLTDTFYLFDNLDKLLKTIVEYEYKYDMVIFTYFTKDPNRSRFLQILDPFTLHNIELKIKEHNQDQSNRQLRERSYIAYSPRDIKPLYKLDWCNAYN